MTIPLLTSADVEALRLSPDPLPSLGTENPDFKPRIMASDKNPVLYGVEIEFNHVGATDAFRKRLDAYQRQHGTDFFACKYDGSLRSGVEVVTHPFSAAWFRANRNHFRNLLTIAHKSGAKVGAHAGLHVHISRKGLRNSTKARLFHFINDTGNRDFVGRVAGRDACNAFHYHDGETLLSDDGIARHEETSGKYEAVNWQHDNTIEIRVFKSTTKSLNLFARLQFVFAAIAFCRKTRTVQCTAQNFQTFLDGKKDVYDSLSEYLRDDDAI